jgi:hypothetical protein
MTLKDNPINVWIALSLSYELWYLSSLEGLTGSST